MFNNKNRLSQAIFAAIASSSMAPAVMAQTPQGSEPAIVEEVLVTGIRASLERSMDIKRDSAGVVDAISAEDIGKFPDTNLAESLQRITGVSIDRTNGEGSRITVRGFGPDYNMVTLNGRTMPGGSTYGGSSGADDAARGGNSRAFDFANLASEAVSSVEVYKTGKANIAAGGIGASVNIGTTRPLDNPGFHATVGAKAVHDTTNREGSDITPEFSTLVSWTDDSNRFGVSFSGSFQQRDSGFIGATVNEWHVGQWGFDEALGHDTAAIYGGEGINNHLDPDSDEIFFNPPEQGDMFTRPNDIRYAFSDRSRERTNAQLTLQFAPRDNLIATVDYTFAQNNREEFRGEVTNWVQNNNFLTRVEFNDAAVAVPTLIREDYRVDDEDGNRLENATMDIGFAQQYRSQEDTLKSFGLNLEWDVNEDLTLAFDAHHSTMDSLPSGPGRVGEIDVGIGAQVKQGKNLYFGGALPSWDYNDPEGGTYINDCAHALSKGADDERANDLFTNCNGDIDEGDLSSAVMRMWSAEQQTEVTQIRLDGVWQFEDGRFEFGLDRSEQSANTIDYNSGNEQVLGGWGADNPGEFSEGTFDEFNFVDEFDDFDTGSSPGIGFKADARDLAEQLVDLYDGAYIGVETNGGNVRGDNLIEEDTTGIYAQVQLEGEFANLPYQILTGLRYEHTDLTSTSSTPPLSYMEWQSDDDFAAVLQAEVDAVVERNSYDALLPNFDLTLHFSDDLIGRASFSKTIARPSLNHLNAAVTGYNLGGSTLLGAVATADAGNSQLVPLESTNFDFSLEYYYEDASYVSVGLWEKRVVNFIGNSPQVETFEGVYDQTSGSLAREARDLLEAGGYDVSHGSLHAMMVLMQGSVPGEGPEDFAPSRISNLNEEPGGIYDFGPRDEDENPLMEFQVTRPVNTEAAKIHGLELAVQHFFGDTGFGVMANYTMVRGDVGFDDLASPDEEQFAVVGLSDTANLVLMYENYGVSARLAYNWRDEFLARTNVGTSNNPGYVEAHSQIDLNVSYDVTDNIAVSFEGINLTGENRREFARNKDMLWGLEDLGARFQLGARYTF